MPLSLIGLPGAGKTTIGLFLSSELTWPLFQLGRELRRLGREDEALAQQLASGALGPESLVARLVEDAVEESEGRVILDGYPRHLDQLAPLLNRRSACFITFEVPIATAASRVRRRRTCMDCDAPVQPSAMNCNVCGSASTSQRPEDMVPELDQRLRKAQRLLAPLVAAAPEERTARLSANRDLESVKESALTAARRLLDASGEKSGAGQCQ